MENILPSAAPRIPKNMVFSPAATNGYYSTVAACKPETLAALGGFLHNPNRVEEVRFVPPERNADGTFDASSSHFAPDIEFLRWVVHEEWRRLGISLLGFIHSHPNGMTKPSRGAPGSNRGDIAAAHNYLKYARENGMEWPYVLMPITTFDAAGKDLVTGWIVTLDSPEPHPAKVIFEDFAPGNGEVHETGPMRVLSELMDLADAQQEQINRVLGVTSAPEADRLFIAQAIRGLRRAQMAEWMARRFKAADLGLSIAD